MTGDFASAYLAALRHHLETGDEAGLERAHDLGRRALTEGFGILAVLAQHEAALRAIAADSADSVTDQRDSAQPFLLQSLAALDMATRAFVETAGRLAVEQAHVAQLRTLADAFGLADTGAEYRLQRIADATRQVLNAPAAFVRLSSQHASSGSIPVEVARTAAAVLSETGADAARGSYGDAWPGQYWVAARLEIGSEAADPDARGIVLAGNHAEFGSFDEAVLTQLANLASASLHAALLYERERNISITLQSSLLPKAPASIAGLNIAAEYQPSGPAVGVGGDWFDVIQLGGDSVGLVMGDVMGHGLPAAAFMGQISVALRAYAVEGHSPAAALDRLDDLLSAEDELRMATVIYATIDADGRLCFANAGHPPPLLVRPDGPPEYLHQALSHPIGIAVPNRPHREHVTTLRPGSTLVLYTDGLIERRGRDIDVGLDQLARTATDQANRSAAELCTSTLAALAHPPSGDDACILAVHRPSTVRSD